MKLRNLVMVFAVLAIMATGARAVLDPQLPAPPRNVQNGVLPIERNPTFSVDSLPDADYVADTVRVSGDTIIISYFDYVPIGAGDDDTSLAFSTQRTNGCGYTYLDLAYKIRADSLAFDTLAGVIVLQLKNMSLPSDTVHLHGARAAYTWVDYDSSVVMPVTIRDSIIIVDSSGASHYRLPECDSARYIYRTLATASPIRYWYTYTLLSGNDCDAQQVMTGSWERTAHDRAGTADDTITGITTRGLGTKEGLMFNYLVGWYYVVAETTAARDDIAGTFTWQPRINTGFYNVLDTIEQTTDSTLVYVQKPDPSGLFGVWLATAGTQYAQAYNTTDMLLKPFNIPINGIADEFRGIDATGAGHDSTWYYQVQWRLMR